LGVKIYILMVLALPGEKVGIACCASRDAVTFIVEAGWWEEEPEYSWWGPSSSAVD
jgi:hypothetical protein